MVMVGCTKHENIIGNMTSIIPSATSNSTPTPTTSIPTPLPPDYAGKVALRRPGQGPADIWVDKYDAYPNVLTVEMGTTVTWTDLDTVAFTCVSDNGLFAGNIEPNGGKWSYLFDDAGYFGYSIDPYNGELLGVVIVLG